MADFVTELLGFVIWVGCVVLFAFLCYLAWVFTHREWKRAIPDAAFEYRRVPDFLPKDGYFLDTHSHTLASDGKMTPEQNIRWHIANGFHAFVLTDHNTGKNNAATLALQQKYPQILLIPGYEWTTERVHLNFLGVADAPAPSTNYNPSDEEVKEVIARMKAAGAVVQICHISWTTWRPDHQAGKLIHPSREQLAAWGVDTFEINNEMRWYDPLSIPFVERWRQQHPERPLALVTGTDIHKPTIEWATCWTELLLTPAERQHPSWEVVKRALLEGRTRTWVDHDWHAPPEVKYLVKDHARIIPWIYPFWATAGSVADPPREAKYIVSLVLWLLFAYVPLRLLFGFLLKI